MRGRDFLLILVGIWGVVLGGCQSPTPEGPLVLRYTGLDEETEEIVCARLASIVDANGRPVYRFARGDDESVPKSGSKFCVINGAEVEFRPVPFPQYRGADDIFTLALSTQTKSSTPAVHLFFVDLYWFQTFSSSWLMPFEGKEWAPSNFKHDFIEACCLPSEDGRKKVYAIPFTAKANMLFYRKDLLDLFDLAPPETWDGLKYAVQTIRELVGGPDYPAKLEALLLKRYPELKANAIRLGQEAEKWKVRLGRLRYGLLLNSRGFHNDFYPIVWGYGGDIFTSDPTKQRLAVQALRDVKALFYDDTAYPIRMAPSIGVFEGPFAEADFQLHEAFAGGDAVFMINWDNRLDKMFRYERRAMPIDNIGVCPIPHAPDGVSASNIGSWGWVVNRLTVNSGNERRDALAKAAVEQFLRHLTGEEAQEWLAEHYGLIPSREIALSERVLANLERTNPAAVSLFRFFRTKGKVRFVNRPGSKHLNDILEQALHRAISETPQKDPAAEMNFLSKVLADVRAQAGYL